MNSITPLRNLNTKIGPVVKQSQKSFKRPEDLEAMETKTLLVNLGYLVYNVNVIRVMRVTDRLPSIYSVISKHRQGPSILYENLRSLGNAVKHSSALFMSCCLLKEIK